MLYGYAGTMSLDGIADALVRNRSDVDYEREPDDDDEVYINEDHGGYVDDAGYHPSMMEMVFKDRGDSGGCPKLTYLPGGDSFAPAGEAAAGETGEAVETSDGTDWRARALEADAALKAAKQAKIDGKLAAAKAEEAAAKAVRKAEWMEDAKENHGPSTRNNPFDAAAAEAQFEAEDKEMMEEEYQDDDD